MRSFTLVVLHGKCKQDTGEKCQAVYSLEGQARVIKSGAI